MRMLSVILSICIVLLQYRLWFGKNSIPDYLALKDDQHRQIEINAKLAHRNSLLYADIDDLRDGTDAIEEKARNELGMIKEGETFFRIIPATDK